MMMINKTTSFISRSKGIHGDTYDYSLVEYINARTNVKIICKDHGVFEQTPQRHVDGRGCQKCGSKKASDSRIQSGDQLIERFIEVHGDRYDYSLVDRTKGNRVDIVCKEHGIFNQLISGHLNGKGCKWCGIDSRAHQQRFTTPQFIQRAKEIHDDKYDYSLVNYVITDTKVKIKCKKHKVFEQRPNDHLRGKGCPRCTHRISKPEQEIADFIKSKGITVLQSDRTILNGLELDIVLPDFKIAIEHNGIYHHSEKFGKDKNYHRNKTLSCEEQGYRLIHIWGDDYTMNKERELNFISHQLGLNKTKPVYARKCDIKIDKKHNVVEFLNTHHVQGFRPGSYYISLYHGGDLVSVTVFLKKSERGYELIRHSSSGCVGSLGKAVKYFANNISNEIYTFCDIARFNGTSYDKAGFKKVATIPPDYKYVVDNQRKHKFGFRKKHIKNKYPEVYEDWKTERQMMEEAKKPRIWDCGKIQYKYVVY